VKINARRRISIIRFFTVGWILAFEFLGIVRGVGTVEEGSADFSLPLSLALGIAFGLVFGAVAGLVQVRIEERLYRRVSLRRLLVVRLLAALIILMSINFMGYFVVTAIRGEWMPFGLYLVEPGSLPIFFYMLCVDTFLFSLRQVNLMLGEGNLWKLIRGAFYTPREQERIFMFLDLKSSTTLAEELGHVKYSTLIQDCFDDLGVVAEYGAAVYQYVGDGVVLTWSMADGLRNANCISAYFRFRQRLSERGDHYRATYGTEPVFTAGINAGVVTVTEVGKFRKDIAFHGDTINTAARIEGQCKELNEELLVSERVATGLSDGGFDLEPIGSIPLRGKEEAVNIFSVTRPSVRNDGLRP